MISQKQRPPTNNIQHSQETIIPPAGFEPAIPANERPQSHTSARVAAGTGTNSELWCENFMKKIYNRSTYFRSCKVSSDDRNFCLVLLKKKTVYLFWWRGVEAVPPFLREDRNSSPFLARTRPLFHLPCLRRQYLQFLHKKFTVTIRTQRKALEEG